MNDGVKNGVGGVKGLPETPEPLGARGLTRRAWGDDPATVALIPMVWPRWAVIVGWVLVVVGIVFCVRGFAMGRTLYVDEVNLARNFLDRGVTELVLPLEGRQMAPLGFLAAQWWVVRTFGADEYTLRIVSTAAAIAALPMMLLLARRVASAVGGLVAVALLAFGADFLYYASQNKQYTLEFLVTCVMLWLTLRVMDEPASRWRLALWGLAGVASFWFSYTAAFVVAGLGVALVLQAWWYGRLRESWPLYLAGAATAASLAANYVLIVRPQRSDPALMAYMNDFWGHAFLPVPLLHPGGFLEDVGNLFENPGGITYSSIAMILFIVGWLHLGVYRCKEMAALGSVVVVSCAASMLHLYPLAERLAMFLLPVMLLVIGAGFDFTRFHGGWRTGVLVLLMAGLLLVHPVKSLGRVETHDDLLPVLRQVEAKFQPGDTVYVYGGAVTVTRHYVEARKLIALPEAQIVYGIKSKEKPAGYADDLAQVYGRPRVWLVFAHVHDDRGLNEERLITLFADKHGKRVLKAPGDEASAYLYDFSASP